MHTEVQEDAAVLHMESQLIDAPRDLVYDIISDVEHWPEWHSAVSKTDLEGSGKKGRMFKWHSSGMTFKSIIHTASKPEEFGIVARTMWFKVIFNWTLEPFMGGTRVSIEESITGLGAELMKKSIRSSMTLTLMELKKYAESRVSVSV
jgi:uncharacterized protein YndB with AHSA1/START domain